MSSWFRTFGYSILKSVTLLRHTHRDILMLVLILVGPAFLWSWVSQLLSIEARSSSLTKLVSFVTYIIFGICILALALRTYVWTLNKHADVKRILVSANPLILPYIGTTILSVLVAILPLLVLTVVFAMLGVNSVAFLTVLSSILLIVVEYCFFFLIPVLIDRKLVGLSNLKTF